MSLERTLKQFCDDQRDIGRQMYFSYDPINGGYFIGLREGNTMSTCFVHETLLQNDFGKTMEDALHHLKKGGRYMEEIKNAKITGTMLGREDHGILTFLIYVDISDGSSCGIGGYALDYYVRNLSERKFSVKGIEAISKILETVGVDTWEDLPGQYIRIKWKPCGPIEEIGNLMSDKWFNLREFFSKEADA